MTSMATNCYIDGFNLYNGALRSTQYKWLDIEAMCHKLLPSRQLNRIRYFTAHVTAFPHDPYSRIRQNVYLRALRTFAIIQIHDDGWFASRPAHLPVHPLNYPDPTKAPLCTWVIKNEEKRTDVDIATNLLLDCFKNDAAEYVLISNDSDLVSPLGVVRREFRKTIGVINPHERNDMSGHLEKVANWSIKTINPSVLRDCQLPPSLTDSKGVITKPPSW